ncbi:hypothetical protein MAP00_000347 [Monascus purpureus]|nr:hypothetical protein MAP00_000347 [Monascus purpureus]
MWQTPIPDPVDLVEMQDAAGEETQRLGTKPRYQRELASRDTARGGFFISGLFIRTMLCSRSEPPNLTPYGRNFTGEKRKKESRNFIESTCRSRFLNSLRFWWG